MTLVNGPIVKQYALGVLRNKKVDHTESYLSRREFIWRRAAPNVVRASLGAV
jgi:hypothetical protein